MIKKTTDYALFKFRSDNRPENKPYIKRLVESIRSKNLLEFRPIYVNKHYEIIDGQHRLLAAEILGVPIYYQINEQFKPEDIIIANTSKSWGAQDYLNFYYKNGHIEYEKLYNFVKTNNIQLKIALILTMGQSKDSYYKFKNGEYKFIEENFGDSLELCWETINYIKKINGNSHYLFTARFWKALIRLFADPYFDIAVWRQNIKRFIGKFGPRVRNEDYIRLVMEVHNWKNNKKIDLIDRVF